MEIAELINTIEPTTTVKRHKCTWPGCPKSFSRPSDTARHYRTHTNDRPFACLIPWCGKRFIQRSALTVHSRTHSGERPHVCEFRDCGKSFSDSSSLARHRRIHTGNRPYRCQATDCTKSYTKKAFLIRHIQKQHGTLEKQPSSKRRQSTNIVTATCSSYVSATSAFPSPPASCVSVSPQFTPSSRPVSPLSLTAADDTSYPSHAYDSPPVLAHSLSFLLN
ncbi:hypothetical protein BCR43DRAFT_483934 [Syncephalastrum racemosum]|uniref:C2H2-type domain-containing protein n=1 Tax=Syncephalastrum racemosum TaxID=13706 RepID=A0A1X2HW77_SYNRA|nr:hypothetical protein BCR43DRAFT_483934 [Syncephalastrum racemosum]